MPDPARENAALEAGHQAIHQKYGTVCRDDSGKVCPVLDDVKVIVAAVKTTVVEELTKREVVSVFLDELPDWTELGETVGAELRDHEIGCSGEYETVMHWPDGRRATGRDRMAIISADAELPTVAEQEAWWAEHERVTRALDRRSRLDGALQPPSPDVGTAVLSAQHPILRSPRCRGTA